MIKGSKEFKEGMNKYLHEFKDGVNKLLSEVPGDMPI